MRNFSVLKALDKSQYIECIFCGRKSVVDDKCYNFGGKGLAPCNLAVTHNQDGLKIHLNWLKEWRPRRYEQMKHLLEK